MLAVAVSRCTYAGSTTHSPRSWPGRKHLQTHVLVWCVVHHACHLLLAVADAARTEAYHFLFGASASPLGVRVLLPVPYPRACTRRSAQQRDARGALGPRKARTHGAHGAHVHLSAECAREQGRVHRLRLAPCAARVVPRCARRRRQTARQAGCPFAHGALPFAATKVAPCM